MTPSHWRIALGPWLLAVGLVVSSGGAAAFATPATDTTKDAENSTSAGSDPAPDRTPQQHLGAAAKEAKTTTGTDSATTADCQKTSTGTQRKTLATTNGPVAKTETTTTTNTTTTDTTTGGDTSTGDATPKLESATTDSTPKTQAAQTASTASDPSPTADPTPTAEAAPSTDPAPTTESVVAMTITTPAPTTPSSDTAESNTTPGSTDPTTAAAVVVEATTAAPTPNGDPVASVDPVSVPEVVAPTEDPVVTVVDIAPVVAAPTTVDPVPTLGTAATVTEPAVADDANDRGRRPLGEGANALSPLQILRFLTGTSGLAWGASNSAMPSLAGISTPDSSPASASASGTSAALVRASAGFIPDRVAPDTVLPEDLAVFLHSYGQLIIAASLSAIAAAALPGLAGLAIPTLAGMRIGYRQAKAGRAIGTSGIARFSGSGPMGIVRSGSVVALRRSASRVNRPEAADQSDRVA